MATILNGTIVDGTDGTDTGSFAQTVLDTPVNDAP